MYVEKFSEGERAALQRAAGRPPLEDEADALRVAILRQLERKRIDYGLLGQLAERLARVLRARQALGVSSDKDETLRDLQARVGDFVLGEKRAMAAKDPATPRRRVRRGGGK